MHELLKSQRSTRLLVEGCARNEVFEGLERVWKGVEGGASLIITRASSLPARTQLVRYSHALISGQTT